MRYFVRFSYRGTNYHGSQTQPNGISVQQVMEQAFTTILRAPILLTFAGRTDAGVHAEEMWAHLDAGCTMHNTQVLVDRLNSLLPHDIAVQEIRPVEDDMHARFSAKSRTYEYRITTRKDPFGEGLRTRVAPGLDYDKMNEAAQLLLGRHDFASFCRVHTDVKTTFCTISEAYWNNEVFTITADRFLRNMVRAIVGTLMEVGRGKMSVADIAVVIEQHNRCAAGQSAPAQGLYLTHITYNFEV